MLRQYIAIHDVASDCSSVCPLGSGRDRSNKPMLSRPRKPPSNRLLPSASLRLTHQLKFMSSLWKMRSRKSQSFLPDWIESILNTHHAAHACTGGFTSSKAHSYAGSCPLGCMYHSRQKSSSWSFANS